jgi:UPF0271 protein
MKEILLNINADVGEGIGNEHLLFPLISSCNIACGGHTGDSESMLAIVKLAKKHKLKMGAHPSFPDKENFGRKTISISKDELLKSLIYQIESLNRILIKENCSLHHVKPHGALYNLAANDKETAKIIVDIMKKIDVKLYVPYSSLIAKIAKKANVQIYYELFLDRNYNSDLTLVSRKNDNALIKDSNVMFKHAYSIINNKTIISIDQIKVPVKYDTLCIHGDNPNAIKLLKDLYHKFNKLGIKIN